MAKEVEITRDEEMGRVTDIHIKGIKGPACDDIEKIIAELYAEPETSERTREYYERARVRPQIRGNR